jgi:hypothetical protein
MLLMPLASFLYILSPFWHINLIIVFAYFIVYLPVLIAPLLKYVPTFSTLCLNKKLINSMLCIYAYQYCVIVFIALDFNFCIAPTT